MTVFVVIDPTDKGHEARCTQCGWISRSYPIPDTAFVKALDHKCKEAS